MTDIPPTLVVAQAEFVTADGVQPDTVQTIAVPAL